MKFKNHKKAFSLVELMASMGVLAIISLVSISTIKNASQHILKVKLQKATAELKRGLNSVASNHNYYPTNGDFGDLDEAKIEDTKQSTSYKSYIGTSKFRELLFFEMGIESSAPLDCFVMKGDKEISEGYCYKSADGILWSMPDTNFEDVNTVDAANPTGSVSKYAPITMYPDGKSIKSTEDFNKNAIVFGIRRDANIVIVNNIDCEITKNKNYNQCKYIKLITSAQ